MKNLGYCQDVVSSTDAGAVDSQCGTVRDMRDGGRQGRQSSAFRCDRGAGVAASVARAHTEIADA